MRGGKKGKHTVTCIGKAESGRLQRSDGVVPTAEQPGTLFIMHNVRGEASKPWSEVNAVSSLPRRGKRNLQLLLFEHTGQLFKNTCTYCQLRHCEPEEGFANSEPDSYGEGFMFS